MRAQPFIHPRKHLSSLKR